MIQIRPHTFETNSSSTHSLVMCSDDEYKLWLQGKTYLCIWEGYFAQEARDKYNIPEFKENQFYPVDEIDKLFNETLAENEFGYAYDRYDYFQTADEYFDSEYLESYDETYETKSGEIIHAFGLYGYDG